MNKLPVLLGNLEKSISELKRAYNKDFQCLLSRSSIILGCGVLATIASILWLPKWSSISLIGTLSVYACFEKRVKAKMAFSLFNNIQACTNTINTELKKIPIIVAEQQSTINYEAELTKKQAVIESLMSQISSFKDLLSKKPNETTPTTPSIVSSEDIYGGYTDLFLRTIQRLDFEVEDFGDECASYLRKEFAKSLRTCGLQFLDYSEENKDFFKVEPTSSITEVDCTSRAIVTKGSPASVVVKGHAFVPANNSLL